jgi:hypothetical protein
MLNRNRSRLEEFRRWLVQEIPCDPENARANLAASPLSSLLIHYMNWRDRFGCASGKREVIPRQPPRNAMVRSILRVNGKRIAEPTYLSEQLNKADESIANLVGIRASRQQHLYGHHLSTRSFPLD